MDKNTKRTQNENIQFYLTQLKGMASVKGEDMIEIIEEAKMLKQMVLNESMKGNPQLIKYYKQICDVISQCYMDLPEEQTTEEEKTNIEQAMDILFSKSKAE